MTHITGDRKRKSTFDPNLANEENKRYENMPAPETKEPELVKSAEGFIYVPSIKIHVCKKTIGPIGDWEQTHRDLARKHVFMPTIYQFKEFIKYLKREHENGDESQAILDDILLPTIDWKAEWLDAKFVERDGEMHIQYDHSFTQNGIDRRTEKLEDYLTENGRISLDDWLDNSNKHGLPRPGSDNGKVREISYIAPAENSTAKFCSYKSPQLNCLRWQELLLSKVRPAYKNWIHMTTD
jgi:hypothetical protein